jgi:hypothetical protein
MQRHLMIPALVASMGLSSLGTASAQAPAELRDLVGARAAGGESMLSARGFVFVRTETGDDRKWSYWWNERRGICVSVVTRNGRYDSITTTPAPDCRQGRPTTLPGPVGGPVANGRTEEIRFERGTSSATRRGVIKGYETATYLLDVRAGQSMTVSLQSSNRSGYFNITAPRANQALFNGSISGARYRGRAASSGRYKIEVYLMRNAARRGETARYTLDVSAR